MFHNKSHYKGEHKQGTLKVTSVIDLHNPKVQSAIINLPDDKRADVRKAFHGASIEVEKLLNHILKQKPSFSNERRIELLKMRSRHLPQGLAKSNPPIATTSSRPYFDDDGDPSRLAASLKTATGEFSEVNCFQFIVWDHRD